LDRICEIEEGKFDEEMDCLKTMSKDELRKLYSERGIEPVS